MSAFGGKADIGTCLRARFITPFTYRNLDLGRIGRLGICYAFDRRLCSHRSNRDSRAPQSLCSTYPFPLHTPKHLARSRAAVLLAPWGVRYRPSMALQIL